MLGFSDWSENMEFSPNILTAPHDSLLAVEMRQITIQHFLWLESFVLLFFFFVIFFFLSLFVSHDLIKKIIKRFTLFVIPSFVLWARRIILISISSLTWKWWTTPPLSRTHIFASNNSNNNIFVSDAVLTFAMRNIRTHACRHRCDIVLLLWY